MTSYGYSGNVLKVDLSKTHISRLPTADYTDRFIGGRGLAAKLYWDNVPPSTEALGPDNMIIFTTGPLAGFTHLGGSRWQICGRSPAHGASILLTLEPWGQLGRLHEIRRF
jgi:aldehyde:ferredoxin oxidoreductase